MRLPLVVLILLYVAAIAVDLYILGDIRYRGRGKTPRGLLPFASYWKSGPWLWIYSCVLTLAILTVAVSLPRRGDVSLQPVWWLLYVFLTVYVGKICYILGSLAGRIPQLWRGRRRDTRMWLGLSLALLGVFTMVWGALIGRRHIDIREVRVVSPQVPAEFNGYRIVQFSDAHVDTWGSDTTFVSELVDDINALHPDLIVFTGDIVSRRTSELRPFTGVFSRLKARDGVYSVLGNHDYGDYTDWPSQGHKQANLNELIEAERKMGWRLLNNSCDTIRRGNAAIVLAGVENWGEPPFKQYGDLGKALPSGNAAGEDFVVLLSHNPMHWHQTVRYRNDVDLTLSGHTHAMQCQFSFGDRRFSPAGWRYPEWSGLYSHQGKGGHLSQLYVNIGSGEVAMPSRIGTAFPEVTVITLERGTQGAVSRHQ